MTTYRVLRKSDGEEVYRYTYDAPLSFAEFPEAEYEHVEFVEPPPEEAPVDPTAWHLTKRAFRNRFTQAEDVTIEIASLDNPAASMQVRGFAAVLRSNQRKISDSPYVDLKLAQTREGVIGLEQAGVLGPGRALAILDTPPTDEERFRG